MQIAIINYNYTKVGGSQSFSRSLAWGFEQLGHEASLLTGSNQVDCDLAVVSQPSHNTINNTGAVIHVSHSTFIPIEQLTPEHTYPAAISGEVADVQRKRYVEPTIIYNPINTSIFTATPVRKKPKKLLYIGHDGGGASSVLEQACQQTGLEYKTVSGIKDTGKLAQAIKESDIVAGIGRCILEAMACNRFVISVDKRSWMNEIRGAGAITPENYDIYQYDNFSGRKTGSTMGVPQVVQAIKQYTQESAYAVGDDIRREYDAKTIAQQYIRYISR